MRIVWGKDKLVVLCWQNVPIMVRRDPYGCREDGPLCRVFLRFCSMTVSPTLQNRSSNIQAVGFNQSLLDMSSGQFPSGVTPRAGPAAAFPSRGNPTRSHRPRSIAGESSR